MAARPPLTVPQAELPTVEAAALTGAGGPPLVRRQVTPARGVPGAWAWLQARIGGPAAERWRSDDHQREGETVLVRARDALWAPRLGAVATTPGPWVRESVGHLLTRDPALAALPPGARLARRAARAPQMEGAGVFMGYGALTNYGHFVLDGLTALLALEEAGLFAAFPPAAPPLRRWHRELAALAFPGLQVREIFAPLVRAERAVFATAMDHHLHWPSGLTTRLRARVLEGFDRLPAERRPAGRGPRVYLSRRGLPMRVMVGEAELERRLAERGFAVVHAARLSPAAQVALAREAQVIVGPTGAALANALFASPEARVIEIQPETYASAWTPAFRRLTGGEWAGYICEAPADPRLAPASVRLRRGFRFAYAPDLDELLAFIDARL